jgi:Cof subfamily protein (haloacid dehalogenase superfamily)
VVGSIKALNNTLLVSDLDGTLLDSKQRISKENLEAIKEFQDKGGLFTIATGRMEQSVQPFIELLKIDIPIILYNGAVVYDPISKTIIKQKTLNNFSSILKAFTNLAKEYELGILLYQKGKVFTVEKNEVIKEYERKDKVNCNLVTNNIFHNPITKILLISSVEKVLDKCEVIVKESKIPCETVYSESNYLEILPLGVSKGSALYDLLDYLQRDDLQIVCVGDNLNDESMLKIATRAFVVDNCHDSLKGGGYESTVHHEHHAIADIVHRHFWGDRINGY